RDWSSDVCSSDLTTWSPRATRWSWPAARSRCCRVCGSCAARTPTAAASSSSTAARPGATASRTSPCTTARRRRSPSSPPPCPTSRRRLREDGPMSTTAADVVVGTGPLSPAQVVAVARDGAPVVLGDDALAAIERSRAVAAALADDAQPHYGIATGFGALATRHIPPDRRAQLQRSLVRSHAASSGLPVEREVVRAMMLLRLSTLATGHTGVRPATARLLADLLTHGITPVVRE